MNQYEILISKKSFYHSARFLVFMAALCGSSCKVTIDANSLGKKTSSNDNNDKPDPANSEKKTPSSETPLVMDEPENINQLPSSVIGGRYARKGEKFLGACIKQVDKSVYECREFFNAQVSYDANCKVETIIRSVLGKNYTFVTSKVAVCPPADIISGCRSNTEQGLADITWFYKSTAKVLGDKALKVCAEDRLVLP